MEITSPSKSESRGGNRKKIAPLILLISAAALLCATLFLPMWQRLAVCDGREQKTLMLLPIDAGEEFTLGFLHSRNLSPIEDIIKWDGENFICLATRFKMYGAGVPDVSDGIGTELKKVGEWYELSGINRKDSVLPVMLQSVPDHTLTYRGKNYKLCELFGSGTLIVLSVRSVSLLELILNK